MRISGTDSLQRHAQAWSTPGGMLMVPLRIAAVAIITALFCAAVDRYFAEWMPDGEIVILALGFLILSRFFTQRKKYQEKYGERAYVVAFSRFNLLGLG